MQEEGETYLASRGHATSSRRDVRCRKMTMGKMYLLEVVLCSLAQALVDVDERLGSDPSIYSS